MKILANVIIAIPTSVTATIGLETGNWHHFAAFLIGVVCTISHKYLIDAADTEGGGR